MVEFHGAVFVENFHFDNVFLLPELSFDIDVAGLNNWELSLMPPLVDINILKQIGLRYLNLMNCHGASFLAII